MLGMVPLALLLVLVWSTDSEARRTYITPEQKSQLSQIKTILVSALALSEKKGLVPHDGILEVVQRRFEELGFRVIRDAAESHDVEFHVVCEERKREQGVTRYGGDAELTDAPDRLWHGPACQLSYRLNGRDLGWYKEVHASLDEMPLMTGEISASEPGTPAFDQLTRELEYFDFPVMLLSEWGHTHRLVVLLSDPETSQARELLILDLLRLVPASEALPYFLKLIQEGQYAEEAIYALSGLGHEAIPYLLDLFANKDRDPSIRAAAAKGLGRTMRAEGDPDVRVMLLEYLTNAVARITSSTDIEFPVLTEVVWAIGSIHHKATFQLIDTLQNRIWLIYDTSPEMKKLRDVVSVVHRYMDLVQL
jgi:hypothetical protein